GPRAPGGRGRPARGRPVPGPGTAPGLPHVHLRRWAVPRPPDAWTVAVATAARPGPLLCGGYASLRAARRDAPSRRAPVCPAARPRSGPRADGRWCGTETATDTAGSRRRARETGHWEGARWSCASPYEADTVFGAASTSLPSIHRGDPTLGGVTNSSDASAHRARDGSRGNGLLLFRPFGIPVYVTASWLIVAALITLLYGGIVQSRLALGVGGALLLAFVFAVLLYASVLVHELAHSVVARMYGLPVRRIVLYVLGGVSEIEREAPAPGREFWIAFAGPALSLVLSAGAYGLTLLVDPYGITGELFFQLWVANLLVGVFNLLPGLPLDGGRLLRAGVWKLTGKPLTGSVAAAWGGRVLALGV